MTFQVTVGDCVELSIGSAVVQTGQSACVPVTLVSASVPLSAIQFTLQFPPNRLTNWSISSTNIAVGAVVLLSSSASQAQFEVSALSGHSLTGPANIGQICFQALGTQSGFVTLVMNDIQGTEPDGALAGNATGTSGLVTLVAVQPLLQATPGSNSGILLTLYGNPGSNYVIQSASSLLGNNWQSIMSMMQSNVTLQINVNNSNGPAQFFRAYQMP
jgi:hypothetical protein